MNERRMDGSEAVLDGTSVLFRRQCADRVEHAVARPVVVFEQKTKIGQIHERLRAVGRAFRVGPSGSGLQGRACMNWHARPQTPDPKGPTPKARPRTPRTPHPIHCGLCVVPSYIVLVL